MRIISIAVIFLVLGFQDGTETCFMAKLNAGEKETDATINGERIFSISPEETFLYDNYGHHAYKKDGKFGYIDPSRISRAEGVEFFKFEFSDELFNYSDDNELIELGIRKKIDFRSIISRIRKKDSKAFIEFLGHEHEMDGAATEMYYQMFWMLINGWSDNELKKLFLSSDVPIRNRFIRLMMTPEVTWPIVNQRKYYEKFYPQTFQQFIRSK